MQISQIHHWLYNKIVLTEKIEEELLQWAKSQGYEAETWQTEIIDRYGNPTAGKPLKKAINHDVHLWLYEKMKSAELRQAALITRILGNNPLLKAALQEIFSQNGRTAAREYQGVLPQTPEEIYIVLNDYLLEGMPTDRVNQILSGSEKVIIWRTVNFVHQPYWDEVGGDIANFYDLRGAWVKAFVETLNPEFTYEQRPGGDHKIVRKEGKVNVLMGDLS
jgi:hypothetical protein